ncbi:hypothetical protein M422DRAFT_101096, partial [Sphaerobolus stellatus SS14]
LVFPMSDAEIITNVMANAPPYWATIIDPHRCQNLVEFITAIKYHERSLSAPPFATENSTSKLERRMKYLEELVKASTRGKSPCTPNAQAQLIGSNPSLPPPQYPQDDSNISKGKTPEDKGARPCRHCGSSKHWDNDCRHARSGARNARAFLASASEEQLQAQREYEEAY